MTTSIRGVEPEDLEAIHQIFSGKNVIRGSLRMPYTSRNSMAYRVEASDNWHRFVAVIDDQVVGFAEIETFSNLRLHHVAHLNFVAVRDDMQGQGIGTHLLETCIDLADNYLLARRFFLEVWAESRAVKLYETYGFEIEGRHIDFGVRDGQYADVLTMARIRK